MTKLLVSIFSLFLLATNSHAFDPKGKTVTVTIPFAPGGGVDHTFKELQKYANQKGIELSPVFKPGAESVVGTREVSLAANNGLNFGITTAGGLAVYKLTPDVGDVTIVTGVKTTAQVMVTSTKSGIKNYEDLKKALKEGRKFTVAIGNPGQRLVWDQFLSLSKVKTQPSMVPYKGAGQVLSDIIGGHVDLTYLPITVLKSNIDSGNLIPLVITHTISQHPGVPTFKSIHNNWKEVEFGHVLFVPKGTSPEAIKFWTNFIKDYQEDPGVKEEFRKNDSFALPLGSKIAEDTISNIKVKLAEILPKK
jgi:tripartite-type tricarboxylate transporter receptor subunit TctC